MQEILLCLMAAAALSLFLPSSRGGNINPPPPADRPMGPFVAPPKVRP